jgi:hypothetical protein
MMKSYFKSGIIKSTIIELKIVFVQTSFSKYSIEYSKSKHKRQIDSNFI